LGDGKEKKKGRSGNDMQGVAVAANGAPLTPLK